MHFSAINSDEPEKQIAEARRGGKKKSEVERLRGLSENARIGILYAVAAALKGLLPSPLAMYGAEGEECNPLTLELTLQPAGSGGVAGTVCGCSKQFFISCTSSERTEQHQHWRRFAQISVELLQF